MILKEKIRGIIWGEFFELDKTTYLKDYTFVDHVEDVTEKILKAIEEDSKK